MLGIFGYIKNDDTSQLDKMIPCSFIKKSLFEYKDSNIEFAQRTLNLYKNNYVNSENVILAIEGNSYNIDELNREFDINFQYFSEIILWSYANNMLIELLKRVNGCFHFCLYDKRNKKLVLANDRFGLKPLFFFLKNDNFAFSCDIKSLLSLNFVDDIINTNAINMFADLGYLLGDNTWFKNIRRMKPATIIEYDINGNNYNNRRYWTFKEVQKSDISFEDAVDKAYELFDKSITRQVNINYDYLLTLSAGFDSRLILAALKNNFPDYKPYVVTFGIKNCQDIITAQKICKIAGYEHNSRFFDDNLDWFHERFEYVFACDCTYSIQDMHGAEFLETYPKEIKININGYLGDTVLGGGYLPNDKKLYNSKINKDVAQYYYGKYCEFSDYENEYFSIDNPIVLNWFNRGTNFINEALRCGLAILILFVRFLIII